MVVWPDIMKNFIVILVVGLLSQAATFSQGNVIFGIDFGANPPPHSPGIPTSGAYLTNDQFYAILYLDTTAPVSGSILDWNGGSFNTIFQFSHLVYAGYSGGGVGYDYEDSWQLTGAQMQDLLAGQWYAQVTYNDASYLGQITPVPEPASATLLLGGLVMVSVCRFCRS